MAVDALVSGSRTGRHGLPGSILLATVLALGICSTLRGEEEPKLPDQSAATRKAQQALDSPIDLELNAPTLEVALGRIAAATGTTIRIDLPVFMGRNINLSQPAPPRLKGDSLRTAFEQLWPAARTEDSAVPISAHEGAIQIDPFRWPPSPRSGAFRQGRYVVNGRVVDEADRAVPGAIVRLYCWARVVLTSTDAKGQFFATLPTNGDLSIEAWDAAGVLRGWAHPHGERLGLGPVPLEPVIKLKPPKQVTVRVTDGDQQPVKDANVVLVGTSFPYDGPPTSQAGETTVQIPADLEVDSVIAWKQGVGLDYTASRRSGTSAGPGGPPLKTDQVIALQLSRGPVVRFRVVDQFEKPVAGFGISPWQLKKPSLEFSFNTTHFHGRHQQRTDANGEITFDWLPGWQSEQVSFSGSGRRYPYADLDMTVEEASRKTQTIRVEKYVALRGRVVGMDGKPAPDVYIVARGPRWKKGDRGFNGNGIADAEGRFELFLPSRRPYLIVAVSRDGKRVSPPEERVVEDPATEVDDVVLYLRPAIRVFGRMTPRDFEREDSRPSLRLVSEDFRTRSDIKVPMSESLTPIRAVEEIELNPGPDGSFSVHVGPGRYEFAPNKDAAGIPFELTEQTEYEVHVPPQ